MTGVPRTWIVTWEPRRDPGFLTDEEWDLLAADSTRAEREEGLPVMAWPVPNGWSEANIGDVVFIFRQAVNEHGIVARGEVESEFRRDWGRAVVDLAIRCMALADVLPFESVERTAPSIPWRLLDAEEVHEMGEPDRARLEAAWSRFIDGKRTS